MKPGTELDRYPLRISRHHVRPISPLFDRLALCQVAQLSLPNFAQQKHAAVAAAEVFVAAHRDSALTGLRDFIFEHDEVDAIGVHVVEVKFSREDRPH